MHKKKSGVRLSGKIEKAFEFFTGKLGVRVDLLSIRSMKCTDIEVPTESIRPFSFSKCLRYCFL